MAVFQEKPGMPVPECLQLYDVKVPRPSFLQAAYPLCHYGDILVPGYPGCAGNVHQPCVIDVI